VLGNRFYAAHSTDWHKNRRRNFTMILALVPALVGNGAQYV
jgi:hypothetical protein